MTTSKDLEKKLRRFERVHSAAFITMVALLAQVPLFSTIRNSTFCIFCTSVPLKCDKLYIFCTTQGNLQLCPTVGQLQMCPKSTTRLSCKHDETLDYG